MRPKLSEQELEQLLEAEFLEAEAVAAAEVGSEEETQRKVSPYRVDEDLSSRLNLPRASLSDPQLLVLADHAVCVLTPTTKLSIDDLYSLDLKTPIVYNEGEQGQQEYGFVEKREKDLLIMNGPGMEIKKAYPLHLLESIMINPRILVPELNPRIRL